MQAWQYQRRASKCKPFHTWKAWKQNKTKQKVEKRSEQEDACCADACLCTDCGCDQPKQEDSKEKLHNAEQQQQQQQQPKFIDKKVPIDHRVYPMPFNLNQWIEENGSQFKPPVANKMIFPSPQCQVFILHCCKMLKNYERRDEREGGLHFALHAIMIRATRLTSSTPTPILIASHASLSLTQFKVMMVGGPNQRTDYHVEDGDV